uniref:Uncharacterized protein n=1 Tax=Parascaris equorum TaxID=6256 RepID=A0A914RGF5_PAREQ
MIILSEVCSNVSVLFSESLDVEVRRLPIVEYMRRSEHGTFNIMLAINQVVE